MIDKISGDTTHSTAVSAKPYAIPDTWFVSCTPAARLFLNMYSGAYIIYQVYILLIYIFHTSDFFSLPAAGLSSCSRLRGTQGARPDPIRKFGPRPRSVARALGVQAHANPHVHNALLIGF